MMYIIAVSYVLVGSGILIRSVNDDVDLPVHIKLQFIGGFLTAFFWVCGAHVMVL